MIRWKVNKSICKNIQVLQSKLAASQHSFFSENFSLEGKFFIATWQTCKFYI